MSDPLDDHELPNLLSNWDQSSGDHLDLVSLADYLEGALGEDDLRRAECHLAECSSCRELATDAAFALTSRSTDTLPAKPPMIESSRLPARRTKLRYLATAATLAVALTGLWWSQGSRFDSRLAALGVDNNIFDDSSKSLRDATLAALDNQWPAIEAFVGLTEDSGQSIARAGANAGQPQPVSPRWTAVRDTRPTFVWYSQSSVPNIEPDQILVVDQLEHVVANLVLPETTGGREPNSPLNITYPSELPPLVPGQLYAWKVNSRSNGELVASSYIPFLIQDSSEMGRLTDELASAGDEPILEAVIFAQHGLYGDALAHLASISPSVPGETIRSELQKSLLRQMFFDEDLLVRELERHSTKGALP